MQEYERQDTEVLDTQFTKDYMACKVTFKEHEYVPLPFCRIMSRLGDNYALSNQLKEQSALIIPVDNATSNIVKGISRPKIYIDVLVDQLLVHGTKGEYVGDDLEMHDTHYRMMAEIIASTKEPCILLVELTEFDNQSLQKTLMEHGKHYAIALPMKKETRVLMPYNDPDRWK
jgi:hypothetical protein